MKKPFFCLLLPLLFACGREAAPFPPEIVSPMAVDNLEATAQDTSISFKWKAPTSNQRGRKLTEFSGYRIYRASLLANSDINDLHDDDFKLISTIPDQTVRLLEQKQAVAKKDGKSSAKVKLNDQERIANFTDKSPIIGNTYVYKIAPYNHTWVDGGVDKVVKVVFKGKESELSLLNSKASDVVDEDLVPFPTE